GFVVAVLLRKLIDEDRTISLPQPDILSVACQSDGTLLINVSTVPTVQNLTLVHLYTFVYDVLPNPIPDVPPSGAFCFNPASTLVQPLPNNLFGPTDFVVVWAEYGGFSNRSFEYATCSGSSGSSPAMRDSRFASAARAAEFEAIPRTYRVSPGAS